MLGVEVVPYRAFAAQLWETERAAADPMLLSPGQSRALWRQVVAASPESDGLLGAAGPARWAEQAWRMALAFGLDLGAAAASEAGTDFSAFARWAAAYRARLDASHWIDDSLLDGMLAQRARRAPPVILLADLEPTPAQRAVFARLAGAGSRIDELAPRPVNGRAVALRCTDPRAELEAAAEWAARTCARDPGACCAVVVPDLGARSVEVRRIFRDALAALAGIDADGHLFVAAERSSADLRPLLGAILNALELVTPAAGFATLSRWLRSPFFHDEPTLPVAAAIERDLRDDPAAYVPFVDAWRHGALAGRLRAALPKVAARLDAALESAGGARRRTPSAWVSHWLQVLETLGGEQWPRHRSGAAEELEHFEEALVEVARLTPVVGALSASEALTDLEECMSREPSAALPVAGVHVLASLADVGPGYSGLWVTGATDDRLPRPVELRPFLPPNVQIAAGIPWSSPHDALERTRTLLARIGSRVPLTLYSWPAHVRDEPTEPSPLVRGLPAPAGAEGCPPVSSEPPIRPATEPRPPVLRARPTGPAGQPHPLSPTAPRLRRRERLPDPAPALATAALPGGIAALNAQASCPLRAFCEHRLGARELALAAHGVSPRRRGRILHELLEHVFQGFDSRAQLERAGRAERLAAIERMARRAAMDAIGHGHPMLDAWTHIEAERAAAVLDRFVARELERAPFRISALERAATLELHGRSLKVRIDRIDRLESGGLAIIDYKTGNPPRPAAWLGPRLRDVQLPVYALAMAGEPLAALVAAVLKPHRSTYAGFWDEPGAFPGRPPAGPASLADLATRWQDHAAALVAEYAAGDARLFVDDTKAAAGAYAPLTRVYELLAAVAPQTDPAVDAEAAE